jgi:hypothetical protein
MSEGTRVMGSAPIPVGAINFGPAYPSPTIGWPAPAMTPPADFWDRVAREVAKLMMEQRPTVLGPATATAPSLFGEGNNA